VGGCVGQVHSSGDEKPRSLLHPGISRYPVTDQVTVAKHLRPPPKLSGKVSALRLHCCEEHERYIVHNIISRARRYRIPHFLIGISTYEKKPNTRARSADFRAESVSASCTTRLLTTPSQSSNAAGLNTPVRILCLTPCVILWSEDESNGVIGASNDQSRLCQETWLSAP
jgi:hypothetical protein